MKIVKKLILGLSVLIVAVCAAILVISFNPETADKLSVWLYGNEQQAGVLSGLSKEKEKPEKIPQEDTDTGPEIGGVLMEKPLTIGTTTADTDDGSNPVGIKPAAPVENQKITVIDVMSERPSGNVSVYQKPLVEEITVPGNLSGKTGMVEISEENSEIGEAEYDKILEAEEKRITGREYSFDAKMYPYYAMLDENQQAVYRQIYANAVKRNQSFIPCTTIQVKKMKECFEAVIDDHPELFWLDSGYNCKFLKSGECAEITLSYNALANQLESASKTFQERVDAILREALKYQDPYEQERFVHDFLLKMNTYDDKEPYGQSAYSAIVGGKTVCAGYARAFQYLMQQLGIPCYYCTGYSGENHAWNIIELYGEYYNVDVTWDDTEPATYQYFNKTDREFQGSHARRSLSVNLPACLGTLYGNLEEDIPNSQNSQKGDKNLIQTVLGNYNDLPDALKTYYEACYDALSDMGIGHRDFTMEVDAFDWAMIEEAYQNGTFRAGYMDLAVSRNGADSCSMRVQAILLSNGNYRLEHSATMY